MKKALIVTLIIIAFFSPTACLYAKPITWDRFTTDLLVISKLHLDLPLTKSALKGARNYPISRAEAIYLLVGSLGLNFEANLLKNVSSIPQIKKCPYFLRGAINLAMFSKPPIINKKLVNLKWLKGSLSESEAKTLIRRALFLRKNGLKIEWTEKISKDLVLHWERKLDPPLYICYLKLNLRSKNLKLIPELAGTHVQDKEKLSEMCKRKKAIAGINGGFFAPDGDPIGALMIDGVLISEPFPHRGCFGWNDHGEFVFGIVDWEGELRSNSGIVVPIDGLNRKPIGNEVILYTPFYGEKVDLKKGGVEVVVRNWEVSLVRESGEHYIPRDGFIIAGYGEKEGLLSRLRKGERIEIHAYLMPTEKKTIWRRITYLIQGGPTLIKNYKIVNYDENFKESFLEKKHPRTIIGETRNGDLILMIVDGRNAYHSEGLTIHELKELLASMKIKNALNLDGGGSTCICFNNQLYNLPSDSGKERKISYGLLILPKNER